MKLKNTKHKVKDLIGKTFTPMVINGPGMIPKTLTKCKRYNLGGFVLPERCLLISVAKGYTTDSAYIVIQSKDRSYRSNSYLLDIEFELIELTGLAAKKELKELEIYKETDVSQDLGHSFYIGADPEIFVTDAKDNLIPAFDFLGSKKETTVKTFSGSSIYWDGFQAEFETKPKTCLQMLAHEIRLGLYSTLQAAKKFNPDAKLSLHTVMQIPNELLEKSKDEHVSLGCMPSLNAYKHKGMDVPDPRKLLVRSTGGHLHFGIGRVSEEKATNIVKALDAILGVACVSLFAKYDDPVRRRYYGLAGEYRLPPHGLEYRVLSNAWMAHPFITHLVYGVARKALMVGNNGLLKKWKATEEEVVSCINNCDVKASQDILQRNKRMFLSILAAANYGNTNEEREFLFNIFINGMESVVVNPENIVNNWKINNEKELNDNGVGHSEVRNVVVKDETNNTIAGIKTA